MSNYRSSPLRLVRKVGHLPSLTRKQVGSKKEKKTPGQHFRDIDSRKFKRDKSAYGLRLWEKQRLRFNYNINERQLVNYVKQAKKSSASTGDTLLALLEMRLDNTVFRLGMTRTIVSARQLVVHGHVCVNGKKLTIPSYSCAIKDKISIKPNPKSRQLVERTVKSKQRGKTGAKAAKSSVPQHLSFNPMTLTGVVDKWVDRRESPLINMMEPKKRIKPLLVVEYYSGN